MAIGFESQRYINFPEIFKVCGNFDILTHRDPGEGIFFLINLKSCSPRSERGRSPVLGLETLRWIGFVFGLWERRLVGRIK